MISKVSKGFAAAAVLAAFTTTAAQAATVGIETYEKKIHVTKHGMHENTSVRGDDIAGMKVTAVYVDGHKEVLTWAVLGKNFGGVTGSGLQLTLTSGSYVLEATSRVASIVMEAAPANAVFDILKGTKGTKPGNTLGSKIGYAYEETGGDVLSGDIGVAYSNGVRLAGTPRGTDTFTTMAIDYTSLDGNGLLGTIEFRSDLDKIAVDGDLTPVPLPAGFPLLLAGLAGFGLLRTRRT